MYIFKPNILNIKKKCSFTFKPPGVGGAGQGVRKVIESETVELIESRKFCKHCGSKLTKEQKICKICGNKVE